MLNISIVMYRNVEVYTVNGILLLIMEYKRRGKKIG